MASSTPYDQVFDSSPSTLKKLEWYMVKRAIRWKFPDVRHISTATLAEWLMRPVSEQPLLLDVRTPEEYAVSHIEGALLADTTETVQHLLEAKDRPVVVYCSVGYRSALVVKEMQSQGVTNIFNLEGSLFMWANENRPVYAGTQRVYSVHPYDSHWGHLLSNNVLAHG